VDGCQHLSKSNALFLEFGPKLRVYSLFQRKKELFLRGTLKEIGESKVLFLAIIIWWSANPKCKKRKQAVKVTRNIKYIQLHFSLFFKSIFILTNCFPRANNLPILHGKQNQLRQEFT